MKKIKIKCSQKVAVPVAMAVLLAVAFAANARAQSQMFRANETLPVKGMPNVRAVFNPATRKYQPLEFNASQRAWVPVAGDFEQYKKLLADRQKPAPSTTPVESTDQPNEAPEILMSVAAPRGFQSGSLGLARTNHFTSINTACTQIGRAHV